MIAKVSSIRPASSNRNTPIIGLPDGDRPFSPPHQTTRDGLRQIWNDPPPLNE